jgi:hypothetical protein
LGSSEQASAATSAASTAASAQEQAAQLQYQEWQQQQANMQPWLASGQNALNELNYRMGLPTVQTTAQQGQGGGTAAPASTGAPSGGGAPVYYNSQTGQYSSTPPMGTRQISSYGGTSNIQVPLTAAQMAAQGWTQQGAGGGATSPATSTGGFTPTGTAGGLANPAAFSYNAMTDPGLRNASQFANQEIAAQFAATGGVGSGNMASAIAQEDIGTLEPQYYNQAANTYGQNIYSQNVLPYNFLAAMSGTGQVAANSLASTGQAAQSNIGNYVAGAGASQASGQVAAGSAYASGINSLGSQFGSAYGNYALLNYLNNLNNQSGYSGMSNVSNVGNAMNLNMGVDYSSLG